MAAWEVLMLFLAIVSSGICAILEESSPLFRASNLQTEDDDLGEPALKQSVILNSPSTQKESLNYSEDLLAECESVCKICNATGNIRNGNCLCFSDNGGEVVCIHLKPQVAQEVGLLNAGMDDFLIGEGGDEGERKERCVGMVGSTRGALQNILGQGLGNASSTILERTANFRKRVEALRSLVDAGRQRAATLGAIAPTNTAPQPLAPTRTVPQPSQPLVNGQVLPVSPFTASTEIVQDPLSNIGLVGSLNPQMFAQPIPAVAENQPAAPLGMSLLPNQVFAPVLGTQLNAPPPPRPGIAPAPMIPLPIALPGSDKDPLYRGSNSIGGVGRSLRSPNGFSDENQRKSDILNVPRSAAETILGPNDTEDPMMVSKQSEMRKRPFLVVNMPNKPIYPKPLNIQDYPDKKINNKENIQENYKTDSRYTPGDLGHNMFKVNDEDSKFIEGVMESLEESKGIGALIEGIVSSPRNSR